jgi:SAM-dependent methyltransferase
MSTTTSGQAHTRQIEMIGAASALRLREAFDAAGYTSAAIEDAPGALEFPSRSGQNLPRLLRLTSGGTPLHTLLRLFVLGVPAGCKEAREALLPAPLEEWERAGLVNVEGDRLRPMVAIMPFEGLLLAMDSPSQLHRHAESDFVSGVTNGTMSLHLSMAPVAARRTLDLGTGSGVLGLLAARRGGEVVCTDVNPRALAFARLNATWNRAANVEFKLGDAYEPVRGSRFNHILTNPPCVISPLREYSFRDSGMELDGLCRKLVKEAPGLLEEGGYFQSTVQWANLRGQRPGQRLKEWFEGTGCDALVLQCRAQDTMVHAEETVFETGPADTTARAEQFNQIVEYFETMGVESISEGVITMRRRTQGGANWMRIDDLAERQAGPFGEALLRAFAAKDSLSALARREDLLFWKLRAATGLTVEARHVRARDAWGEDSYVLARTAGIHMRAAVDVHTANLVRHCDGTRDLHEILQEIARSLNVDATRIAGGILELAEGLIEQGFLVREE